MDRSDDRWMEIAIGLTHLCPRSEEAYAVGAVIVATDGNELARGYSRETDTKVHAEESALQKVDGSSLLAGATIYSTLEPCSRRKSRPRSCARLIIDAGIGRVVMAWREPALFVVNNQSIQMLRDAGIDVAELPGFADRAREANRHLHLS